MKLFHKLLLLTAAVGAVPLIIGGVLLIRINQQGIETNILERRVEHVAFNANLVDVFLSNTLKNVGTAIYERDLATMERKDVEALFRFLMSQYDQIRIASYIGPDRFERARALPLEDVSPEDLRAYLEKIPHDQVLKEKQIGWSPVYTCRSRKENVVVVGLPYRDQGMVAMELSLAPVQAIVERIKLGTRGYAVMLDLESKPVAHQKPELALNREPMHVEEFSSALKLWFAGTGRHGSAEGDLLESHQPLKTAKWMLFVVEPERDAFIAASRMKTTTVMLVVGALMLALSGGLWISRAIVSSVYRLLAGTKEIGSGNLSHRIGLESRDEIGELSRAFDSMGTALQSREREIVNIEQMARSLGTILQLNPLLERSVETVLRVVPTRKAGIYLGNGGGMMLQHAVGDMPETIELGAAFKDATEAVLKARTLFVPLRHEDHLMGSLVLEDRTDGNPFGGNDKRFVQVIGSSIALAMRNIQLLDEMVEKARMAAELQTAEVVQKTLFPPGDLVEPGMQLSGYIESASETGGDWYGYLREPGGHRVVIMVGDVTGHGVPAALVTAATHSYFRGIEQFSKLLADTYGRAVAIDLLSPSLILSQLNRIILSAGDRRLLMTFFVATYDPREAKITFANAGHPFPYLYRAGRAFSESRRLTILRANGARLGEDPDFAWTEETERLTDDDLIVWTSDGTTDCLNYAGEPYGDRRLRMLLPKLAELPVAQVKAKVVEDVEQHRGGAPLVDDVTLVVGRVGGLAGADLVLVGASPEAAEVLAMGGIRSRSFATGREAVEAIDSEQPVFLVQALPTKEPPEGSLLGTLAEARTKAPALQAGWLVSGPLDPTLPMLGESGGAMHFFGLNPDPDPLEVASVVRARVEKRLVRFDELAERVLGDERLSLSTSSDDAIERALTTAKAEGAGELALENLKIVMDEMLTNAFYHAPRDAAGAAPYSTQNRAEPVALPAGKEVRVRWGLRGEELTVEVADSFGSFTESKFLEHVRRGLAAGTADLKFLAASAGAGLGVFMLSQVASRLFVGIERGTRTSVICVLDMKARRKKMAEWNRSLHVIELG